MKTNIVKIDEKRFYSMIGRMVNESIRRIINEIDNDYIDDEPVDDWRSEEPSEADLNMAMGDIGQMAHDNGLTFRKLGNAEFGVMCQVGSDANIQGFMDRMKTFVSDGMLHELGTGTTLNGIWHAKFRILKCW